MINPLDAILQLDVRVLVSRRLVSPVTCTSRTRTLPERTDAIRSAGCHWWATTDAAWWR